MARDSVPEALGQEPQAPHLVPALDPVDVARWLAAHPDFLQRHPDLIARLTLPGPDRAAGIVDFQSYQLDRLRSQVERMKAQNRAVLTASRANHNTQNRVHAAALFLMDAPSFEALIHMIGHDLAVLLDLDVVIMLIETAPGTDPIVDDESVGLRMIPAGTIYGLIGPQEIVLEAECRGNEAVFGPAAAEVRSQAFLRLNVSEQTPACMLALGSRDAEMFHPGMATELIGFLARIMERCIRGWLTLDDDEV